MRIFLLFFILSLNIYSISFININGYLKKYDIYKFENLLKQEEKEIFIFFNSGGGKLETIFDIADILEKLKKNNVKIYSIILKNDYLYAGAFILALYSDKIFYFNRLNIGVFTPLSPQKYNKHKKKFDKILSFVGDYNYTKDFFLKGNIFNPSYADKFKSSFVRIETLEDIEYSVENFNFKKIPHAKNRLDIFTPDFIFIILNIAIVLILISVYFTKNPVIKTLTTLTVIFFIEISSEIPLNFKALTAIFFSHFMLIFKEYSKFKYLIFTLSFSIFTLSSIYFISPNQKGYYLDEGFRINIIIIFTMIFLIILIYKILTWFFNKRFKKLNNNQNELINKYAKIVSVKPLKISFSGDEFEAISQNKLKTGDKVKITGFKGLKIIVEK